MSTCKLPTAITPGLLTVFPCRLNIERAGASSAGKPLKASTEPETQVGAHEEATEEYAGGGGRSSGGGSTKQKMAARKAAKASDAKLAKLAGETPAQSANANTVTPQQQSAKASGGGSKKLSARERLAAKKAANAAPSGVVAGESGPGSVQAANNQPGNAAVPSVAAAGASKAMEVCRQFQKGACRRGDKCSYLHSKGGAGGALSLALAPVGRGKASTAAGPKTTKEPSSSMERLRAKKREQSKAASGGGSVAEGKMPVLGRRRG